MFLDAPYGLHRSAASLTGFIIFPPAAIPDVPLAPSPAIAQLVGMFGRQPFGIADIGQREFTIFLLCQHFQEFFLGMPGIDPV